MSLVQEQQALITVSVDGTPLGVFDSFDGGDIASDTDSYRAGGMADPEPLAGLPEVSDVTVSRGFRGERDGPLKKWLNSRVGKAIVIGYQPLNPDKSPIVGADETYSGVIKSVPGRGSDSTGKDVTKLTIVATCGLPS